LGDLPCAGSTTATLFRIARNSASDAKADQRSFTLAVSGYLGTFWMSAKTPHAEVDQTWAIKLVGEADHQIGKACMFRMASADIHRPMSMLSGLFVAHYRLHAPLELIKQTVASLAMGYSASICQKI
jgi:hypothetical protein